MIRAKNQETLNRLTAAKGGAGGDASTVGRKVGLFICAWGCVCVCIVCAYCLCVYHLFVRMYGCVRVEENMYDWRQYRGSPES